jgi:hypothetical protein
MRLRLPIALLVAVLLGGAARAATDTPESTGTGDKPAAAGDSAAASPAAASPAPAASPAAGTDEASAPDPKKRFPRIQPPSLVHADQFGVSVLPGTGYRIIAPYKDNVSCGQMANRVCTGWVPFFIEAQPSFGFARHWDVIVDLRFGVAADFNGSHEFAVAPGVRYWVDPDLPTKFFATFQGVYDLNPQHDPGVKDYDFGVRNANGLMLELMRNLGFYLQFGETLGLVRWLRFEVDGGLGVQARFP